MNKLHTYNVELTATYTINAANEDEAVNKAICRAKIEDLYDYVEEIEYNPEFDDLDSVEINVDEIKKKLDRLIEWEPYATTNIDELKKAIWVLEEIEFDLKTK